MKFKSIKEWDGKDIAECPPHDSILDPGIEKPVRELQALGINTYESCQGDDGSGLHHFTRPTIRFDGTADDAARVAAHALKKAWPVYAISKFWTFNWKKSQHGAWSPSRIRAGGVGVDVLSLS